MGRNRDYKREYETYHKKKEQKKKRAQLNKARRREIKEGRVKKISKKSKSNN
jgi:hypothetical protein